MSDRKFVVCESVAAIVTHLREVTKEHPISLSGHSFPRPRSLCDREMAWDTRLPISSARCRDCREASGITDWEKPE